MSHDVPAPPYGVYHPGAPQSDEEASDGGPVGGGRGVAAAAGMRRSMSVGKGLSGRGAEAEAAAAHKGQGRLNHSLASPPRVADPAHRSLAQARAPAAAPAILEGHGPPGGDPRGAAARREMTKGLSFSSSVPVLPVAKALVDRRRTAADGREGGSPERVRGEPGRPAEAALPRSSSLPRAPPPAGGARHAAMLLDREGDGEGASGGGGGGGEGPRGQRFSASVRGMDTIGGAEQALERALRDAMAEGAAARRASAGRRRTARDEARGGDPGRAVEQYQHAETGWHADDRPARGGAGDGQWEERRGREGHGDGGYAGDREAARHGAGRPQRAAGRG